MKKCKRKLTHLNGMNHKQGIYIEVFTVLDLPPWLWTFYIFESSSVWLASIYPQFLVLPHFEVYWIHPQLLAVTIVESVQSATHLSPPCTLLIETGIWTCYHSTCKHTIESCINTVMLRPDQICHYRRHRSGHSFLTMNKNAILWISTVFNSLLDESAYFCTHK